MAGGTWTTQNKVRPGAYINTVGVPEDKPKTTVGRVLLANGVDYGWGANGVIELGSDSDFRALLGTTITDPKAITIREALKGALTVLLVNSNEGEKAKLIDETLPWAMTAKNGGTRGNDISLNVVKDATDATKLTVTFLLDTISVDEQIIDVAGTTGLVANDYVDISETDAATTTDKLSALTGKASYKLAGGTSKTGDVTTLLSQVMETMTYNVVTTAGYPLDNAVHALLVAMVQRMREEEGYKITAVVPVKATDVALNYEGISAVANGVVLGDGTKLEATVAAAYVAGAASAISGSSALTYAEYPGAMDANPRLANSAIIDNLGKGHIVFTVKRDGDVVIEQDINSLTTFTDDKPSYFAKNQVIRTIDGIANATQTTFENQFIGKVNNDDTGRDLFKANLVAQLDKLMAAGTITNFVADDVTVAAGINKDAILVTLAVQPSEAMEKLYMTITVQ